MYVQCHVDGEQQVLFVVFVYHASNKHAIVNEVRFVVMNCKKALPQNNCWMFPDCLIQRWIHTWEILSNLKDVSPLN